MTSRHSLVTAFVLAAIAGMGGAFAGAAYVSKDIEQATGLGLLADIRFLTKQCEQLAATPATDSASNIVLAQSKKYLSVKLSAFESMQKSQPVDAQTKAMLDSATKLVAVRP